MEDLKKELNKLYQTHTLMVKKASRGGKKFGICNPHTSNKIIVYEKMGVREHLEVTWCHEWFHHYQYACFPKEYRKKDKTKAKHNPPLAGCAEFSAEEEECEAFALLVVKKSKEYNLNCLITRMWLVRMWFFLRDKYPGLIELLEANRPPL